MGDSVLTEVITLKEKNMLDGKLNKDFIRVREVVFFLIMFSIDKIIRIGSFINDIEFQFYLLMVSHTNLLKEFSLAIFVN